MNKILVKIKVPTLSQEYEMFIPINKQIGKIIALVQKAIIEKNIDIIPSRGNLVLIKSSTNEILDNNVYVHKSNIEQGDVLILL